MIRAVFCDIDGTLVPPLSDAVSDRVRDAIHGAIGAGLIVAFATGRTPTSLRLVLDSIGLDVAWGVCNNGATLAMFAPDLPGGFNMVKQAYFDPAPAVRQFSEAVPGALVATWRDGTYMVNDPFPHGELVSAQVAPLDEVIGRPTSKAVMRWPWLTADDIRAAIDACPMPDGVDAILSKFAAWLDLVPYGTSKAGTVIELTSQLGITQDEVVAIGDDYNDVELLAWAGRGVAMAGSPAPVLVVADQVTDDVFHDGAARVLEALVDEISAC